MEIRFIVSAKNIIFCRCTDTYWLAGTVVVSNNSSISMTNTQSKCGSTTTTTTSSFHCIENNKKLAFVCVSVYTLQILHSVTISGWVDGWRRVAAGACWCWLPFDCWWHCCSLFSFLLLLLPLLLPIYHGHLGSTLPAQAHTHLHTLCSSVCLFALALSLSFLPFFLPNHHLPPPTANCTVPVSVTLWCCCFRLAGCFQNLLLFPLSLPFLAQHCQMPLSGFSFSLSLHLCICFWCIHLPHSLVQKCDDMKWAFFSFFSRFSSSCCCCFRQRSLVTFRTGRSTCDLRQLLLCFAISFFLFLVFSYFLEHCFHKTVTVLFFSTTCQLF